MFAVLGHACCALGLSIPWSLLRSESAWGTKCGAEDWTGIGSIQGKYFKFLYVLSGPTIYRDVLIREGKKKYLPYFPECQA